MEGRHPGPGIGHAGRVGRPHLHPHRGAGREACLGPCRSARRGTRPTQHDAVQKFTILALRRTDGKALWERVVREELPHEGTHPTSTWASASAVTDGELVFAHFGSRGLYALDANGKLVWEKDLGDMTIKLGLEGVPNVYASPLVLYRISE